MGWHFKLIVQNAIIHIEREHVFTCLYKDLYSHMKEEEKNKRTEIETLEKGKKMYRTEMSRSPHYGRKKSHPIHFEPIFVKLRDLPYLIRAS